MTTSKSPKRVLVEAVKVAAASLPSYSHRFSPEEVHAAPVVRVFGAEGLLRADVPRRDRSVGGRRLARGGDWSEDDSALDHAAEGRRPVVVVATRSAACCRPPSGGPSRPRSFVVAFAWLAVDTSGFESRHTSRYYAQRRKMTGKDGRQAPRDAIAVIRSWAWPAMRRVTSFWRPAPARGRSRTSATSQPLVACGAGPRGVENDSCRRRLRQRSQSRVGPRRIGNPVVDPRRPRPTCPRRAGRSLSKTDEATSWSKPVWPTVAGRDGQLHDQTPLGRSRQRPHLLASLPTPAPEGPHSQHHHP